MVRFQFSVLFFFEFLVLTVISTNVSKKRSVNDRKIIRNDSMGGTFDDYDRVIDKHRVFSLVTDIVSVALPSGKPSEVHIKGFCYYSFELRTSSKGSVMTFAARSPRQRDS